MSKTAKNVKNIAPKTGKTVSSAPPKKVPPKKTVITKDQTQPAAKAGKSAGKVVKPPKVEEDDDIVDEEVWAAINSFFEENGLNSSQIHSYNDMIYSKIPKAIEQLKYLRIEENGKCYSVEFGDPSFSQPKFTEIDGSTHTLYPTEALQRNTTYASEVYMDVIITPPSGEPSFNDKVLVGMMPVMVKSDLCNLTGIFSDREKMAKHCEDFYDHGGYFVLAPKNEGSGVAQRRILTPQERSAPNKVFVFSNRKDKPKYTTYAEVRSYSENGSRCTVTSVGTLGKVLSCVLPWIKDTEIPLGVVFRALGIETAEDMVLLCLGPDHKGQKDALAILSPTFEYSYECDNQEAALHFIGRRGRKFSTVDEEQPEEEEFDLEDDQISPSQEQQDVTIKDRDDAISYARHLLSNEYLPHVGQGEESFAEKAKFLGYMVKKEIDVILGKKPEDRDHMMNKVLVTTGALLTQQFYGAFRRLTTEIANNTRKALRSGHTVNIKSWIKPNIITNAMHGAISTNAWTSGGPTSKGISQLYEQFNYTAGIANARKISVPMVAEGGKSIAPRDLHESHIFIICPSETPEGKNAGLVKNMALMCYVTVDTSPAPVRKAALLLLGDKASASYPESLGWVKVILNGAIIGETDTPEEFTRAMIKYRRNGDLNPQTSIAYFKESKEIVLSTEAGRLVRPLFVVENGKLTHKVSLVKKLVSHEMTWTELLATGTVELMDKREEEGAVIAGFPSDFNEISQEIGQLYTHCEMHPSLMFGIGGSIIPFPDHNQSPRNTYQSAMGKQAVGLPYTNYRQIMAGKFHTLGYLQKPLALSRAASIIGFDEMPAGQNALVAIAPSICNEEDSIHINQDSIDRGFMVSYLWTCFYAEISEEKGESFGIPTEEMCSKYRGNAQNLCEEGFAKPGTKLKDGDIVIGRIAEVKDDGVKKKISKSLVYEHMWPAVVDSVQIGTTGEGYKYIRVMVVQRREPVVGDKFAARHGQKGTVGLKPRSVDLPFDSRGIVPDIIMNSLAFPSRMTIAMLVELWTGKIISSSSALHTVTFADCGLGSGGDEAEDPEPGEDELWEGLASNAFKAAFSHPKDPKIIDATPFRKTFSIDIIREEMKKYGMEFADEKLVDGVTGKPLKALVFRAPGYYQRLKHMVIDKMHARARGGKTTLTRQPKEGRAAGGGLRTGCMERDCILGQGAARFARDRLMEQSDEFRGWYCGKCGLPANVQKKLSKPGEVPDVIKECGVCGSTKISYIKLPYGSKLINQELMVMNMVPRILTTPYESEETDERTQ